MKIAFIVAQFPLLSEIFILNQITGLIDRGHKVDIYADIPEHSSQMHNDVKKYNLLDHTYYHYSMMPNSKILRVIKGIVFIIRYVHKNPVSLFNSVNFFKFGGKAASLGLLFQIIPFLEKGPFDIIHCHFGTKGNFAAFLKDLHAISGKVITTFHGFDMSRYIIEKGENVYDSLFTKGDLFLPISECWKNKLIELGCCKDKIIVHRMGIDTNKFLFSPRKPRNDGKVKLLTIARLVEKKGVKYSIKAVAKVLKRYPRIEYKIAGDGPLKSALTSLITELNINNNVQLLGGKQQEEVVKLMEEADIFLAPSVTSFNGDQEGIPVVLMEALAQGLPVISTSHSGIPELVHDKKSGLLVPERDVNALAEKLEYLFVHQDTWSEMGKEGRKHVEEKYDINKLNDKLVGLYGQLLNGK